MENQENLVIKGTTSLSPLQRALAKRRNLGSKDILLIDYSGSMAYADSDNRSKILGARACVEELRKQGFQFTQYVFSDECTLSDFIPAPFGGTNLANAIRTIASQEQGFRRLIVVSDGSPDSRDAAFAEATKLDESVIIDTFYIGPQGGMGEEFLKELSTRFRGSHGQTTALRQLGSAIAGILTADAESLASPASPIAL